MYPYVLIAIWLHLPSVNRTRLQLFLYGLCTQMYVHMHPCACTCIYTPHQYESSSEVVLMHGVTECIWECSLMWGILLETGNYLEVSSGISKTCGSTDIKHFGEGVTHLRKI